jgi:hypothetical protein
LGCAGASGEPKGDRGEKKQGDALHGVCIAFFRAQIDYPSKETMAIGFVWKALEKILNLFLKRFDMAKLLTL